MFITLKCNFVVVNIWRRKNVNFLRLQTVWSWSPWRGFLQSDWAKLLPTTETSKNQIFFIFFTFFFSNLDSVLGIFWCRDNSWKHFEILNVIEKCSQCQNHPLLPCYIRRKKIVSFLDFEGLLVDDKSCNLISDSIATQSSPPLQSTTWWCWLAIIILTNTIYNFKQIHF